MTVHWVVPGLLGPLPRGTEPAGVPRARPLERLLSLADRGSGPDSMVAALFPLFGLPAVSTPPTASLCYLADSGTAPNGWICHADPVYLVADQDRLLLHDAPRNDLSEAEASAYVTAFNAHFASDGLKLHAPHPGRWYLAADRKPDVVFHELDAVVGRNVDLFLPKGPEARPWRSLLNEVQMLFHGLPANEQRAAAGKTAVSGLWFSGGGELPARTATSVARAAGSGVLLAGLCRWSQVPLVVPEKVVASGEGMILVTSLHRALLNADVGAWQRALETFCSGFTSRPAAALHLYPCDGRSFHYCPPHRRRWWRRTASLDRWVRIAD